MRPLSPWFVCVTLSLSACSFGWDALDPRLGAGGTGPGSGGSASVGGSGGEGAAGGGMGGAGGTGGGAPVCGDGVLQPGEECDDGGMVAGDGCDASCAVECDGIKDTLSGHCYVLSEMASTWTAARQACMALGTGYDLAAVASSEEHDFLTSQPTILAVLDAASLIWIGANDMAMEGTFVWSNGEPFAFDAWHPDEPNDSATDGEDCGAYLLRLGLYGWDDRNCEAQTWPALCELTPAGR